MLLNNAMLTRWLARVGRPAVVDEAVHPVGDDVGEPMACQAVVNITPIIHCCACGSLPVLSAQKLAPTSNLQSLAVDWGSWLPLQAARGRYVIGTNQGPPPPGANTQATYPL